MKSYLKKIVITLFILTCLPALALALNTLTTGFQVGSSQVTIDAHGTCQKVNATDGKSYFVPTNTATEWSAFRTNKPAGVSLGTCEPVRIYLTSGSTWTVPANWNPSANYIEVIGGGGSGDYGSSNANGYGHAGGGGGGYSKVINVSLPQGQQVAYSVGNGAPPGTSSGNPGGDTWFCNSMMNCTSIAGGSVIVGAKGGKGASGLGFPAAGGAAAEGIGTIRYSGGSSWVGGGANNGGMAGGGAAGPHGNGGNGGPSASAASGIGGGGNGGGGDGGNYIAFGGPGGVAFDGTSGGSGGGSPGANGVHGNSGSGGGGGASNTGTNPPGDGGNGGNGNEWDADHGSGGGGGGGGSWSGTSKPPNGIEAGVGGNGGLYGGGAGGAGYSRGFNTLSGSGGQGIIVITYTPL